MSALAMLQVKDLMLEIAGSRVLNGITFEIPKGGMVGIIGPNGSGKTTLFNCISGFHQSGAGQIFYAGQAIEQLSPHARARLGIARIFQNFGIFREMSVLDNMLVAMETRLSKLELLLPFGPRSSELKEQALVYLDQVGLKARANARASSLSGGQMRLLEISRALAFGADLFLLDEPTAGVAPVLKERVAQLITELQALGKTVMVIEHDINFIRGFCKRILVLNEGRVVMDDTPSAIDASPLIQEIYFGKQVV